MSPSKTVLVLGANGRFGRAATQAFSRQGWQVLAQTRKGTRLDSSLAAQSVMFDLDDTRTFHETARTCAVIVNALNPPYPAWSTELPKITQAVLQAAEASGSTVMLPGNVYNYGASMPPLLQSDTPDSASTKKGQLRVEMEAAYQNASQNGIQTIILRIGDFLERRSTGNWFDTHMTRSLARGKFAYPGRSDITHAWGYLPDAARALVGLADIRNDLPAFADVPFAGTTLTGHQMVHHISKALQRPVALTRFPWWAVRLMSPFNANMREVLEMRYLWDTPHQFDDALLKEYLPSFEPTPIGTVVADILADHMTRPLADQSRVAAQSA